MDIPTMPEFVPAHDFAAMKKCLVFGLAVGAATYFISHSMSKTSLDNVNFVLGGYRFKHNMVQR